MPTAVLDLELENLPPAIVTSERYDRALIVIRLHGYPVAKVSVPLTDGRMDGAELRDRCLRATDWQTWERWLHHYLGWDPVPLDRPLLPTTVAVCTRDRPQDLERCLGGLLRMPDDGQELLVVDSHPSNDATQEVVDRYGGRVRYVREERTGLDRARNRALAEARGVVVAFIDDDATPDSRWLRELIRNFYDPMVLCVTGLTMPLELETQAQEWFERYTGFGRGFKRTVFDRNNTNPLTMGRVGAGANMALRRRVTELVGPFDEALDAGTPTRSGGDTEMFSRILGRGYRIVYTPTALNWHRHRCTWDELRQTVYGYGVGTYAFWTRRLLAEGEWSVLGHAWRRFWGTQLPSLWSALRKRRRAPAELVLAELKGCAAGPRAYLQARKGLQREREHIAA